MMPATGRPAAESHRLPVSTYLLSLAQALNLTAAVLSVTVAALVGSSLAPNPSWGTLPYGVQFAAVMMCTYPAAMIMRKRGRRFGFGLGAAMLMVAGLLGYVSVQHGSFVGLTLAHGFLGAYIACANFYRFAAVDHIAAEHKPRAISLVVSGGVLAALLGPLVSVKLGNVDGHAPFALCYAALCILSLLTAAVLLLWKPPPSCAASAAEASRIEDHRLGIEGRTPVFIGIVAASVGYFVMNLLMVQSSLVMSTICSFQASSLAIQGHVLAMFVPSFFTGTLIARCGPRAILALGFGSLAAACGIAVVQPPAYGAVFAGLLLLGLGWNFAYVGGGAVVAEWAPRGRRDVWQGLNDTAIAACATFGAFLPAPLLAVLGWGGSNALSLMMCLAAGAICWAGLSTRTRPKAGDAAHARSS